MLTTIAGFDRIGEENAFAVLRPRHRASGRGPRHHQSRHRPARLPHPRPHRRSRDQGAPRRPPRLYAGDRHQAASRGGRRRHPPQSRRRGLARPGDDRAGRQGDDVRRDPDVRRTRRRIMYPDPGFPIYRSMIEFTGATPVPIPIREEHGFAFSAEETLPLITPQDPADDRQLPRQPDRRRHPQGRRRPSRRRPCRAPPCRDHVGRDLRADDL